MANTLEWTNAFSGRVTASDLDPFNARCAEMATRLAAEIPAGKLPFLNLPFRADLEKGLAELAPRLSGFRHMLLLGIGGSALGARALQKAFFPQQDQPCHNGPWLWIADNVDAASLEALFTKLPPAETVVVVVSKSGDTIETIGQYFLAAQWLQQAMGERWAEHLVFITDAVKGYLRELAVKLDVPTLPVPDNLGGRYSALSAVGMVPAKFLGLDCEGLLRGAQAANSALCGGGLSAETLAGHPAWRLAVWNRALMAKGYSQLIFFSYIPHWACFGAWFNQLWAESLGKGGNGTMPLPAVGVTDQHSLQQMFLDGPRDKGCLFLTCPTLPHGRPFPQDLPEVWAYLRGVPFGALLQAEGLGTQMALASSPTPMVELRMAADGTENAGRLMGLLEATTLLTGWLLDINPLDQPAVELGKRLAKARLGAEGYAEEKAQLAAFLQAPALSMEF